MKNKKIILSSPFLRTLFLCPSFDFVLHFSIIIFCFTFYPVSSSFTQILHIFDIWLTYLFALKQNIWSVFLIFCVSKKFTVVFIKICESWMFTFFTERTEIYFFGFVLQETKAASTPDISILWKILWNFQIFSIDFNRPFCLCMMCIHFNLLAGFLYFSL